MGLMRQVRERCFFAQEIRRMEMLFTEMRENADGTSQEGESLESVV